MNWTTLLLLGGGTIAAAAVLGERKPATATRPKGTWQTVGGPRHADGSWDLLESVVKKTMDYHAGDDEERPEELYVMKDSPTVRVDVLDLGAVPDGMLRVDAVITTTASLPDYQAYHTPGSFVATTESRKRCQRERVVATLQVKGGNAAGAQVSAWEQLDCDGDAFGNLLKFPTPLYNYGKSAPKHGGHRSAFDPALAVYDGRLYVNVGTRRLGARLWEPLPVSMDAVATVERRVSAT